MAALALALALGPLGTEARADEGAPAALRRFTRPTYTPPKPTPAPKPTGKPAPTPTATPSPSRPPPENQLIGADDRLTRTQADVVGPTLPGVLVDPDAFVPFGSCTATHLGRGIFLTAGHCIDQQIGLVGFRTSPCPFVLVLPGRIAARCKVTAFRYDATNDFALLELDDPSLASALPYVPVDYTYDWRVTKKRWIRLYGLSGGTLRANLWCEGRYDSKSGRVLHSCDTEGGDSGSAIIDMMTGHVIGVHGGALTTADNYGYPIDRIPWAESLCVALQTTARLPVVRGGAMATLHVSTSDLRQPYRQLTLDLNGRITRANARIRVRAPEVDMVLDPAWMTWSGTYWRYKDVFILDGNHNGPWSIEAEFAATPAGSLKKGYIDGRVWVCP